MEEPTRADDFAGHARIAAECRTPIQIGENLWGPHDLTKILSVGASDFVMLDVMKIGGITGWLRAIGQTEAQRTVGSTRTIFRRDLHRRARYRLRQDRLSDRRARRGGERHAGN